MVERHNWGGEGIVEPQGTARDWAFTLFLTLCYVLSVIDRFMLAFVAQPLRRDLHLSDLQLGLLQGFAFSVIYAVAGIPLGVAVDRYRRTWIVSAGIGVWSMMTMLCGLAAGFGQLATARVGVGVGEATLTPATFSMLGDMFPRRTLAAASTVYSFGPTIATVCAAGLSGLMLSAAAPAGTFTIPLYGTIPAWRVIMLTIGLPGLFVAMAMLFLREPVRKHKEAAAVQPGFMSFILRNRRLYVTFQIAAMLSVFSTYAANAWVPSVLERSFQWTPGQTGATLGIITLICGTLGTVLGGVLSGWCVERRRDEAILLIAGLSMLLEAAVGALVIATGRGDQFAALAAISTLLTQMVLMLNAILLQLLTPPELRGRGTALAMIISIGFGAGAGPMSVGAVNTLLFNENNLKGSLGVILLAAGTTGAILFASCMGQARRYLAVRGP